MLFIHTGKEEIIGRRLLSFLEKEDSALKNTDDDDKSDIVVEEEDAFLERCNSSKESSKVSKRKSSQRSSSTFEAGNLTTLLKNIKFSIPLSDSSQCEITVTILDFAGDSGYYVTHHTFFTPRAIYILLFDISKGLGAQIKDKDLDPSKRNKHRIIGNILSLF